MEEYFNKVINGLREWVRGLVQYAITAVPSPDGYDQVKGREVGPNDPQYQIGVRRFGNYGFRSMPPVGSEAILVNINGSLGNKAEIASENIAYGPSTDAKDTSNFGPLKEGEVSLFSKFKSLIRLKTSGAVSIDSATNSDVVMNGGIHKVARVGDHAKIIIRSVWSPAPTPAPPGTFILACGALTSGGYTPFFQFQSLGVVLLPSAPGTPYDVELDSEIFEGADHVFA